MKTSEIKNIGHYRIANVSAVAVIFLLGANSILKAVQVSTGTRESLTAFGMVLALLLLIPIFRSTRDYSKLAFITPLVLLAFNIVMMMTGGISSYFLLFCLTACGISCLYSNFPLTVFFTVVQFIVVGVLFAMGYPIAGTNLAMDTVVISLVVFVFSCVVLLILTRYATVILTKALDDGNSFRTFLETTANYLAMVNHSNQVIYVSKPLSDLAGIDAPELAEGRSFTDLFPGRDLKLLAGDMLGQWGLYERDWEFVLDGQKRYFKAASNTMSGANSKGTLINLHDMTYLAERDEIAAMKDSLKIGLFFMDRGYIIQDNYSRFLEELLAEKDLNGKNFIEMLSLSVTSKEQDAIKDYFDMVFDHTFDQATLDDINPLHELHYVGKKGDRKIFQCEFITVERGKGQIFILVTIYDITAKVELEQRLLEEETRRQEEMRSLFELIQVDPNVFNDFLGDAEYEFARIDETLKNDHLSAHDALVEVYQSVHAIKSNSVILGLNTFGDKVHALESKIKKLRESETEVSFDEMLHLTVEIERIAQEKDGFKGVIEKINSFKVAGAGQKQNQYVLIETLAKTTNRASSDLGKSIQFVANDIDGEAIDKGPRRLMKEVLMQLIRNSVVHGIEMPEVRRAKKKNETGLIRLSIKTDGKMIHVRLLDDGGGLDFDKISKKALALKMIKPEEANNKNVLLNVIFSPGFSTADDEEGMHGGRGIGLNLVRDRVRDAKGTIKLQTEKDKGTVFNVFLPLGDTAA
ncbi:MAG: ATP-binding protein [Treponema sp.]|nr:ATP-binding protein [Treponema sp.]